MPVAPYAASPVSSNSMLCPNSPPRKPPFEANMVQKMQRQNGCDQSTSMHQQTLKDSGTAPLENLKKSDPSLASERCKMVINKNPGFPRFFRQKVGPKQMNDLLSLKLTKAPENHPRLFVAGESSSHLPPPFRASSHLRGLRSRINNGYTYQPNPIHSTRKSFWATPLVNGKANHLKEIHREKVISLIREVSQKKNKNISWTSEFHIFKILNSNIIQLKAIGWLFFLWPSGFSRISIILTSQSVHVFPAWKCWFPYCGS